MPLVNMKKPHQTGFTLIEVMISVFVLAVGLLGLAGLQMAGLKSNHSAQLRTQAIVQTYDIIDRMRINKIVAKAGGYDIAMGAASAGTAAIKDRDRDTWKAALLADLPNGDGSIVTAADVVTVSVQWDDSRGFNGSSTQTFSISTEL